jgi:excinuclease ABC subunit B
MFKLTSNYQPTGDQPQAIQQLCEGLENGEPTQCLLGVTGSGKTFTMANVIAKMNRPTLILTHNKTLTAQLYSEFRQFFPDNAVEYFVSYYDFYQPEAYMPTTDTYIEKDMLINEEIDKLRLRTTASILSGRRDIIVVASVSCIYGMGNPTDYKSGIIHLRVGQTITRNSFLYNLVESLYSRTEIELTRGEFRVKGDTVDIFPAYADSGYRVVFFGDEIESLHSFDPESGRKTEHLEAVAIFPANLYIPPKGRIHDIISDIQDELLEQVRYFKREGKEIEAARIQERTDFDLEMIKELGYCSGVENYSRFFDGRDAGTRPFCLLDYFPSDFILFVDESHATIPQLRGMWGGDRARKQMLIGYGFRLPSAMDNRPLRFDEFESVIQQHIYVSATPSDYELEKTEGVIVEQLVRPTGLLDPPISVRPSLNQIDDLLEEIKKRTELNQRVLVTTLTKRMTEELTKYFQKLSIKVRYIHSEVDTMERVEILRDLQLGEFDVLVGVNLLREGLDLPEVSLVAILDADKEGFLRNQRSLTQTAGRAARNVDGLVIFYADKITDSMQRTIDETLRRRAIQMQYNDTHGVTPRTVTRSREEIIAQSSILDIRGRKYDAAEITPYNIAAETEVAYSSKADLKKQISAVEKKMREAAKTLDFITAAQLRDEASRLKKQLETF